MAAGQDWLLRRLRGLQPSNFGCEVCCIACSPELVCPPSFREVWFHFAEVDGDLFEREVLPQLSKFDAVLVLSNPFTAEQVQTTSHLAARADAFGPDTPPLFWVPHTVAPEVRPRTHCLQPLSERSHPEVFQAVKEGFEGILVDEPWGMRLALQVRAEIHKFTLMQQAMDAVEAHRADVVSRAHALRVQIHRILWEYPLLGQTRSIPPLRAEEPRLPGAGPGQLLTCGRFGSLVGFRRLRGNRPELDEAVRAVEKKSIRRLQDLKHLHGMVGVMRTLSSERWRHPNLTRLLSIRHSHTHLIFHEEYPGDMSLFSRLTLRQTQDMPLSLAKVCSTIKQAVSAVAYLHAGPGICHRDVKPESLLLTETEAAVTLKLCAFDLAVMQRKCSLCEGPCGTIPFAAPEVLTSWEYDGRAADMWSLGMVLLEVLCGVHVVETGLRLHGPEMQKAARIARSFAEPATVDAFLVAHARGEVAPLLPKSRELARGVLILNVPTRWKAEQVMPVLKRLRVKGG